MKRINTILTAVALVAACAEKPQVDVPQNDSQGNLVEMTLNASVDDQIESKTTYSGRNVFWEEDDSITVFFEGEQITRQTFTESWLSDDMTKADFTGLGDESASGYVAVYPASDANTYDGTALNVTIPSVQTAVANSFESGANVSVACSSEAPLKFRNVGSLIAIKFETAEDAARTASITFRAKTAVEGVYHGLTGAATVNIQEQQPAEGSEDPVTYLPAVTGEGSADFVTLNAPEGGFEYGANKSYYAVIYPGDYADGFEVTFTTNDQTPQTFVICNDEPVALKRNTLLSMGVLPNPYDTLPDEFSISLDFTSDANPLGAFPKLAEQKADGDVFYYSFQYVWKNGVPMTETMEFMITRGTSRPASEAAGYYQHINFNGNYATKQLYVVCNSGDTKIKLPAIKGRYLKSVSMSVQNTDNRRFRLQNQSINRYVSSPWAKAESATSQAGTTTVSFPNAASSFPTTTMGVGYIMQLTDKANYNITGITVVYTKQAPVAVETTVTE